MTPDELESASAEHIREQAATEAFLNGRIGAVGDDEASTAAILCRALELATPGWSAEARARLFMPEELPPSSLEQEYDLATYGDWISDANQ